MESATILLTTFRLNGEAVQTAVSLATSDGRHYFRTWDQAGKHRRLQRNPMALVAPSTFRGKPIGREARFRAELLGGNEAEVAARALRRRFPVLHGVLVPLAHRLRGLRTVHYRLRPAG